MLSSTLLLYMGHSRPGVLILSILLLALQGTAANAATPTGFEQRTFSIDIPHGLARANEITTVEIERGKTILLNTAFEVSRLAVGDPEIADFVAINEREIEILARTVGDTNLLVWGGGRLQAVVDIHVSTLQPQIVRELSRLLQNPDVQVDVAGGSIILRGHVPTLEAFEQATLVAQAYLTRARNIVAGQDVSAPPQVINLLEIGGKHQVMVEVVIAELTRNARRAMGVNIMGKVTDGSTQAGTFQTMLKNLTANPGLMGGPGSPAGMSSISESVTLAGSYFQSESMDLRIFLEAVEANQLGSILAKPTVVARSGEPAEFLVGGEVPIPLVTNVGANTGAQYTVIFKKFGVQLNFIPTVLSENRIHLQVTPEVSEPDFSAGVSVLGQVIPSFITRRVTTSVELGNGESFVLAGLLREDILGEVENMPFLADVPILGQLFRTRAITKTQTELVVILTPHIVTPLPEGTEIELPTDHYIQPTMLEFYWDGRIEGRAPKELEEKAKADKAAREKRKAASKEEKTEAVPEAEPSLQEAWGAVQEIDLSEPDGMGDIAGEPTSGGFVGPVGYRIESPRPTGGIQ
jgi:pilus assembly protein CpaC